LGELSQEAQTTLLGGTLFEYGDQARTAAVGSTAPPESGASSRVTSCRGRRPSSPRVVAELALCQDSPGCAGDVAAESQLSSGSVTPMLHANQAGLQDLLRLGLDRVLQLNSRQGLGITDPGFLAADSFPPPSASEAAAAALLRLGGGWNSALHTARSSQSAVSAILPRAPSPAMEATDQAASSRSLCAAPGDRPTATSKPALPSSAAAAASAEPPLLVVASPSRSFGGALGSEELQAALPRLVSELEESDEDEGIVSVASFAGMGSARSQSSSGVGRNRHDSEANSTLDETTSVWGLGDTIQSATSTARSGSAALSLQQSARTVRSDSLDLEGGLDAGAINMLQQLALENLSLDESLARSMRRVLQLGTVLTGQRLSDNEICALPKVRFDQAEQQNCPICLEAFQRGALLTSLRCQHYFHVDCLGRWFRRSTQCPLCRHDYGGVCG